MTAFKRINANITEFLCPLDLGPLFLIREEHRETYREHAAYAWMWMLIPIAGMVFFLEETDEAAKKAREVNRL